MSRGALRGIIVAAACAAAILGTASAAAAAQRYASPKGSGTACTQASPCAVDTAFDGNGGDEVIVAPGDYGPLSVNLFVPPNGYAHGVAGQPAPRIHFTGVHYAATGNVNTRLSYMQFDGGTSDPLEVNQNTEADQIYVHSSTADACLVYGTLIDSVCWTSAPGKEAVNGAVSASYTPVLRNVTAEATGTGGLGVEYHASSGGQLTITAVDLIAHGEATDIQTEATLPDTTVVNTDHSNFATSTPIGSGANVTGTPQTQPPLFVNSAAGDFNEIPGSPTIDAGVTSPANGAFDYFGRPRVINGMTDIGAAEYDPFNGVILNSHKARLKKGKAPLSITCPAGTPPPCAGTLTLSYRHGSKTSTAGKASFSIGSGATAKVKVKIKKPARRRLGDRGKLKVTASADATDGAGTSAGASGKVKLKA